MKKLVLFFFEPLKYVHLKKDVGLFPVYFRKKYFDKVELICFQKETDVPAMYRGIEIKELLGINSESAKSRAGDFVKNIKKGKLIKNFIKKDNDVSHIMMFHATLEHLVLSRDIKIINPAIKIYIKFDSDIDSCEYFVSSKNRIFYFVRKKCIPYVDLFSVESELGLEVLKRNKEICKKIFYVPNGYDDSLLVDFDLNKKKKQIITVGRLGTYQKNTGLFLEIISGLEIKDWCIKLIGPVADNFKNTIESFYQNNPHLKGKVEFTGNIIDEKEMVKLYAESSVFVLTSRFESSALVLIESAINGCYILSTDVGSVRQISSHENFCFVAPDTMQEEKSEEQLKCMFKNELQKIIDGNKFQDKIHNQVAYCKKNFLMSNVIQFKCFKDWIE